jgi:spore maturation protein CgeB
MKPRPIKTILISRSAEEDFWEPSWRRALEEMGLRVGIHDTFSFLPKGRWGRLQHRLLWGPGIARANRGLVDRVRRERPDVCLMNLGHHYWPETLREIRRYSFLALYHNDDPFGPRSGHPRYRLLHRGLLEYQGCHFYRPSTAQDALKAGANRAAVLLDFYRPWEDYPRRAPRLQEAVYIGHFEPGFRVECVNQAVRSGLPLKIYSNEPHWKNALPEDVKTVAGPFPGLYGEEYRRRLSSTAVCVCFLSRWNRDVYTKRVFEVPACGGFLLCERTDFMRTLFHEGREADYFSSPAEFKDKLRFYLKERRVRDKVAAAGRRRLLKGRHSIHDRMRQWLKETALWRG